MQWFLPALDIISTEVNHMSDKHELEQNEREQPLSMTSLTFITGFVGGVFGVRLVTSLMSLI